MGFFQVFDWIRGSVLKNLVRSARVLFRDGGFTVAVLNYSRTTSAVVQDNVWTMLWYEMLDVQVESFVFESSLGAGRTLLSSDENAELVSGEALHIFHWQFGKVWTLLRSSLTHFFATGLRSDFAKPNFVSFAIPNPSHI